MIVITEIKTIEVPNREYVLEKIIHNQNNSDIFIGGKVLPEEVLTEVVRGIEFVKPDGTHILIGCSSEAAEIIGIQYDAYYAMQARLTRIQHDLHKVEHFLEKEKRKSEALEKELNTLKKQSLLKKLIWCFKCTFN